MAWAMIAGVAIFIAGFLCGVVFTNWRIDMEDVEVEDKYAQYRDETTGLFTRRKDS